MKSALILKLSKTLGVPIYDGVVPSGMEVPSCVVLPTEYRVEKTTCDGAEVVALVTLAVRGEDALTLRSLCALTSLPQGERAYRGENIKAKSERDVTLVSAEYRVHVTVEELLDAPMMAQMDLHQEGEQ